MFWFGHSESFFKFPGNISFIDIWMWSGRWSQVRFWIDFINYGQKLTWLLEKIVFGRRHNFDRYLQFVINVFWIGHFKSFFKFLGVFSGLDIRIWSGIWSQVLFLIDDINYGQKAMWLLGKKMCCVIIKTFKGTYSLSPACFGLVILNTSSSFLGISLALISGYRAVYGHRFAF